MMRRTVTNLLDAAGLAHAKGLHEALEELQHQRDNINLRGERVVRLHRYPFPCLPRSFARRTGLGRRVSQPWALTSESHASSDDRGQSRTLCPGLLGR